ncbi:MAG: DUF4838 domain-containing protein [Kiritimatiellae bacterium]|nr:DUF4838 domain-containing protein [Kiritimatiellia bacterium]
MLKIIVMSLVVVMAAWLSSCTYNNKSGLSAGPQSVCISKNGKALMPIIVSADPIPAEKTAAAELIFYLSKITGAHFEIIRESAWTNRAPAIYLGPTAFAQAHGVNVQGLGAEESVLKTVEDSVIISGGRPRGTLYAVYDLLEKVLGVRWYTPWVERVPHLPVCVIPALNRQTKPCFFYRGAYTHLSETAGVQGWKMFTVRNRLNDVTAVGLDEHVGGGVRFGGRLLHCHGFAAYLPTNRYFSAHPEYYSMYNGQRVPANGVDGNQACLANPDVLKIITDGVKQDIRADMVDSNKSPYVVSYSVSVNDGNPKAICDCPECRKIARQYGAAEAGSQLGRWTDAGLNIWFVNQVADAIKDEFPGKYIWTLAYGPTTYAPKNIQARENVIVELCNGASQMVYLPMGTNAFDLKLLPDWSRCAKHIWIRDYANGGYCKPKFFQPIAWKLDEQFKFYKSLGTVDGIFQQSEMIMEASLFPQFYEMDFWIFTRLCQDPGQEAQELIEDFINGCYGRAAPMLLKYLALIHGRLPKFPYFFFTYDFIRESQSLFDQAEKAAGNDAELLGRVRDLRIQLDMITLVWRNTIIRDYLSKGGKMDDYPFRISVIKPRALAYLDASKNPYIQSVTCRAPYAGVPKTSRKLPENFTPKGLEPVLIMDIAKRYIEEISAGSDYTPLPVEFENVSADRIIDLTAPLLSLRQFPIVTVDREATLGLTVPILGTNEIPMNVGTFNLSDPSVPVVSRTIKAGDIKGGGYHLYEGPEFRLYEWTYLWMTSRWQPQPHLFSLYDPAHPEQKWKAYVSMKFTGAAYPFGRADEENGVLIDRVILVKLNDKNLN